MFSVFRVIRRLFLGLFGAKHREYRYKKLAPYIVPKNNVVVTV